MQLSVDRYSFQVPPKHFFPETYKVVIVGNFGAGKTALLWRFLHKDFGSGIIDVVQKRITVKENDIELEIWDTAGQERFRTISPSYYAGAHAIIIVYDMTDRKSFVEIKQYWIKEIAVQFGDDADHHLPIMLIGTKADLAKSIGDDEQKLVKKQDVLDLKKEYDRMLGPYECSAVSGKNVDKAFNRIAEELVSRNTLGISNHYDTYVPSNCKICQ
uniref:Uncharacterized protein n=1 Tax=Amphimedon queenslandica TaxID=400682 RepID=A0A1X7U0Q0_AMPQE